MNFLSELYNPLPLVKIEHSIGTGFLPFSVKPRGIGLARVVPGFLCSSCTRETCRRVDVGGQMTRRQTKKTANTRSAPFRPVELVFGRGPRTRAETTLAGEGPPPSTEPGGGCMRTINNNRVAAASPRRTGVGQSLLITYDFEIYTAGVYK